MKRYKLKLVITDKESEDVIPWFNIDLGIDFEVDNMALWNVISKELARQEKKANADSP